MRFHALKLPRGQIKRGYHGFMAQRAMNHLEKLFVIKRLNQESDCANFHRDDPRGGIFVSRDHDSHGSAAI